MKSVLSAFVAISLLAGCSSASHTVSSAGKAATVVVRTAGNTAVSTVGSARKLAQTSVTTAGHLAKTTAGAVVDVTKAPFVMFKDKLNGTTREIVWREGMTLAQASQLAGLNPQIAAFQVLRGTDVLKVAGSFRLQPGDVIELVANRVGDKIAGTRLL